MRARATRRLGMDLMMLLFLSMGCILYLLLPYINIPQKREMTEEAPPPENAVKVEVYWPDHLDSDVDLWVQAPWDVPVGYSNLVGRVFNLLRDDLGHESDLSKVNREDAETRGIPDGEYTINAHLYNLDGATLPVPVRVVVYSKKDKTTPYKQLFAVSGELLFAGQELTMARFKMQDGEFVPDSFNSIPRRIRGIREAP